MATPRERRKKMLDKAIADFAVACADQTERDHQALMAAVASGHSMAETGVYGMGSVHVRRIRRSCF